VLVLDPPRLDCLLRLLQRREPVLVEASGSEVAVESPGEGVFGGLAGAGELRVDPVPVRPGVERLREELRSVVDRQPCRRPARRTHPLQDRHHPLAGQRETRPDDDRGARFGLPQGVDDLLLDEPTLFQGRPPSRQSEAAIITFRTDHDSGGR
jgi:hypothetical protein